MDATVPNPYRVKLTFAMRCFIFAAHHHKGFPHALLARTFDINSQTVGKLCRSGQSRHYKNVFEESRRLGLERMWETYANESLIKRIEETKHNDLAKIVHGLQQPYLDSGPGAYYIRDSHGKSTPVEIMPVINGFGYRPKGQHEWRTSQEFDRPFVSIAECLRYLAEYPFEVE